MRFLDTILETIFPIRCISCGNTGFEICEKCFLGCEMSQRETPDWIFPIFDYRNEIIKKAIWFIKYKGKKRLVNIFSYILYGRIIEELSELKIMKNFTDPILMPIPISKSRYRERGFNQAELICQDLAKADKNKHFRFEKSILIKIKETPRQAKTKNKQERLKNLEGSFGITNPKAVMGKNIILIDDVVTTGATLSEAKSVLKSAGAKKVIAFTIAH